MQLLLLEPNRFLAALILSALTFTIGNKFVFSMKEYSFISVKLLKAIRYIPSLAITFLPHPSLMATVVRLSFCRNAKYKYQIMIPPFIAWIIFEDIVVL